MAIDGSHQGATQSANVRFQDASGGGERGYRYADRMTPASIDKINALFERDFDLFGYERIHAGSR
jgi:hypothetical protein